ncbi:hypothetical protein CYMTET_16494 [Cymbomonas tetramitiformis]|uniref:Uncharacterized protein n=1 Tax=Cymbomonas tetramitiformis TaxID=36881 RepID=A0AAE0L7V6_9CHLO|nr:hypothetical protein CYMTET_16494 [Cymbomonas tetramitiformis]
MNFALPPVVCMIRPVEILRFWFGDEFVEGPALLNDASFILSHLPRWKENVGKEDEDALCKTFYVVLQSLAKNPGLGEWASPDGKVALVILAHYISTRPCCDVGEEEAECYKKVVHDTTEELVRSKEFSSLPVAMQFILTQIAAYFQDHDLAAETEMLLSKTCDVSIKLKELVTLQLVTPKKELCATKLQANYRGYKTRSEMSQSEGDASGKANRRKTTVKKFTM